MYSIIIIKLKLSYYGAPYQFVLCSIYQLYTYFIIGPNGVHSKNIKRSTDECQILDQIISSSCTNYTKYICGEGLKSARHH